jgi:membrane glycosyltransferase
MNALVKAPLAYGARLWDAASLPDLPADAPLAMPVQSLAEHPETAALADGRTRAAMRLGSMIILTALMTIVAMTPVCRILAADTLGPLDAVIIVLVSLLFAWTAFSFLSALAGFLTGGDATCELGLTAGTLRRPLSTRTAVLMPIYNEAPDAVFARIQAVCESIVAADGAPFFDVFVLSDTTDAAIRTSEYGYFQRLRRRVGESIAIYYRHRAENVGRKAGNVADWVRRFGAAYDHMVVLDADSLMEGETLVHLAVAMERYRDVGLIQTVPVIVNRHTLFARAEQFASRLYGPMLARGVAWWSGSEGNYWGHNAIIRVAAFAEQAGLPTLEGRKPFGGHIMSHDFVEAALLRRAGWRVCMAPNLGGSYEESPPTLAALLVRDRRWCQGNLQHIKVLGARGLHWVSRVHLARGVLSYLAAPLWLALLAAAALLALFPAWGQAPWLTPHPASPADVAAVGAVFGVSVGFLLTPKLMAFAQMAHCPGECDKFGGAAQTGLSLLVETVLSTLIAPIIMISHARSLAEVLAGRDSGWSAQAREASQADLRQAARLHAPETVLGLVLAVVAVISSARAMVWMTPVIVGLSLAIPLATLMASDRLGRAARRWGLLVAPEELRPPQILRRANALAGGTQMTPVAEVGPSATEPAGAGLAAELA